MAQERAPKPTLPPQGRMAVFPLYPPTKFAVARAGIESGEGPKTKERTIFHEGAPLRRSVVMTV